MGCDIHAWLEQKVIEGDSYKWVAIHEFVSGIMSKRRYCWFDILAGVRSLDDFHPVERLPIKDKLSDYSDTYKLLYCDGDNSYYHHHNWATPDELARIVDVNCSTLQQAGLADPVGELEWSLDGYFGHDFWVTNEYRVVFCFDN